MAVDEKRVVELLQKKNKAYYRVELCSKKGREKFYCFTNPIWVKRI